MSQELDTAPTPADGKGLHSRRALVAGVLGAGVGAAAAVVATAQPASADNGQPVILGEANFESTTTTITNDGTNSPAGDGLDVSSAGGNGLQGTTTAQGFSGVAGVDNSGDTTSAGVTGTSSLGVGVTGTSQDGSGVSGASTNGPGVSGSSRNGAGVEGFTASNGGAGVLGVDQSSGGGTGVSGTSDNGTGVQATSTNGTALAVSGKVTFSRSGTATVPAGGYSVTVSQTGVSASSLVLATLQQAQGSAGVAAAVPGTGSFTISLTDKAKTPLPVAWFVIG